MTLFRSFLGPINKVISTAEDSDYSNLCHSRMHRNILWYGQLQRPAIPSNQSVKSLMSHKHFMRNKTCRYTGTWAQREHSQIISSVSAVMHKLAQIVTLWGPSIAHHTDHMTLT